jgi:hypothetical protein
MQGSGCRLTGGGAHLPQPLAGGDDTVGERRCRVYPAKVRGEARSRSSAALPQHASTGWNSPTSMTLQSVITEGTPQHARTGWNSPTVSGAGALPGAQDGDARAALEVPARCWGGGGRGQATVIRFLCLCRSCAAAGGGLGAARRQQAALAKAGASSCTPNWRVSKTKWCVRYILGTLQPSLWD